ncbi:integral peroxisomal membrane peroxin-domain-containing protein [Scheffersomyces xylosifermentans]|uniref:integral peroxisomal membrane peroxin-domain-containing protein n=1 Tax=Scheffersomyces xylosifermentans TaxID=1304137 RepID=UPI00315DEDB1
MDSVSSFFENILVVEPSEGGKHKQISKTIKRLSSSSTASTDSTSSTTSTSQSTKQEFTSPSSSNGANASTPSRPSLSNMDFSSFWNYSKTDDKDPSKRSVSSGSILNSGNSFMTDKLVEKIISMIIPMDVNDEQTNRVIQDRIEMQKSRPSLSMNIMSTNSRQLNQRLTSTFINIDNIIRLVNWTHPYYTVGVLLIITHLIINPYLLSVLPLVLLIGNVLIPHYLLIYPPDTSSLSPYLESNPIPSHRPLHDYRIPKPVPEFSREFLLNLTDMQNHMIFYIVSYDFILWLTNDYLYFKDESLTSIVFLGVLLLIISNLYFAPLAISFFASHFYILQTILVISVWAFAIILHPYCRGRLLEWIYKEETRLNILNISNRVEERLINLLEPPCSDIDEIIERGDLSEQQINEVDIKEVEIFELQKLNNQTKIWSLVGFTSDIYTVNTATRKYNCNLRNMVSGHEDREEFEHSQVSEKPKGYLNINKKSSINDIMPPKNWKFLGPRWELDLEVNAWVKDNYIEDLVLIDDNEKWVYDYQEAFHEHGTPEKGNEGNDTKKELFPQIIYRRRRWIRNCVRESYRGSIEP